jgi:ribosomal protein L37AE/L43A
MSWPQTDPSFSEKECKHVRAKLIWWQCAKCGAEIVGPLNKKKKNDRRKDSNGGTEFERRHKGN